MTSLTSHRGDDLRFRLIHIVVWRNIRLTPSHVSTAVMLSWVNSWVKLLVGYPVTRSSTKILNFVLDTVSAQECRCLPSLLGEGEQTCHGSQHPIQGMPPIAGVGTHLAWPAAGLPGLRPFPTYEDVWTINFIHGTVTGAFVDDSIGVAADAQFEGFFP